MGFRFRICLLFGPIFLLLLCSCIALADDSGNSSDVVSTETLINTANQIKPPKAVFVKDAPVLGYKITSDRFEDIPEEIRKYLGTVDNTTYTPEYLRKNIGSVISLQMNGDKPDFYIIGKDTYNSKYTSASIESVASKNAKYFGKAKAQIPEVIDGSDPHLVAMLKTTPTEMIKMSDLGYPLDKEVKIQSPWGEQTKPGGADAYLVWDEGKKQYYMVNTDAHGNPLSYVQQPAKVAANSAENDVSASFTERVQNPDGTSSIRKQGFEAPASKAPSAPSADGDVGVSFSETLSDGTRKDYQMGGGSKPPTSVSGPKATAPDVANADNLQLAELGEKELSSASKKLAIQASEEAGLITSAEGASESSLKFVQILVPSPKGGLIGITVAISMGSVKRFV